jgi:hypothetical protein
MAKKTRTYERGHAKGMQVSFREEEEFAERVRHAAELEELSFADFVRKVFRHGFMEYQRAGSLFALRKEEREAMLDKNEALARELFGGNGKKVKAS